MTNKTKEEKYLQQNVSELIHWAQAQHLISKTFFRQIENDLPFLANTVFLKKNIDNEIAGGNIMPELTEETLLDEYIKFLRNKNN